MKNDELWVHNQSYQVRLKESENDVQEKRETIKKLKDKVVDIALPTKGLSEIQAALKLGDKFTINTILEYLKLDTYEFVKTIWWVLNKDNVLQATAYIDWALQRNDSLIKQLSQYTEEKKGVDYIWKGKKNKKL